MRLAELVFDETLREVVKQLCMNTDTPSQFNQENLPSKPQDWKNTPGLYESLLDLCRIMIKKVGESNLPANTGELQNCVVDFYLGHSSENVRNSACNLFLTLIISAAKNPNRLRYLLNKVLENWQ
ncbi:unnamed protein product [Heterobilharzia americana]|nr:unnamed protein product [Heterobilharzia americana]